MGRRERTIHPTDGQVSRFALELRHLRAAAGKPTYRELAKRTSYSVTTLADAASGNRLPTLSVTLAFVEACGGDRVAWAARWRTLAAELGSAGRAGKETNEIPYVGLATFQKNDRHRFFGREGLVGELAGRVASSPLLALSGPSGSGKSSLISAGLVPVLKRRKPPFRAVVTTPGPHPRTSLAHALDISADQIGDTPGTIVGHLVDRHSPSHPLLVVIDQFEELFTICQDEHERTAFIVELLTTVDRPDTGVHFLLGVRADLPTRSTDHPDLVAALHDRTVPIGPIDLRSAIVKPAATAGVKVEEDLTEKIIADAAGEPGGLPLVSCAMEQIWKRRNGRNLTLDAYLDIDSLRGVATQIGEATYNQLDSEQRDLTSDLFLRLTTMNGDTNHVRRQIPMDELLDGESQAVTSVIEYLAKSRVVTVDENGVTIAHDAFIRGWPRLQTWLTENRLRDLERAVVSTNHKTVHLRWLLVSLLIALLAVAVVLAFVLALA